VFNLRTVKILFLVFISSRALGQVDEESFRKYSYLILKIDCPWEEARANPTVKHRWIWGTCAFIKSNNRIFLVTAAHVLRSSYDAIPDLPNVDPAAIHYYIRVYHRETKKLDFIEFTFNDRGLDKYDDPMMSFKKPDVEIVECKNLSSAIALNTIDDFIENNFKNNLILDAFTWGYPNPKNFENSNDLLVPGKDPSSVLREDSERLYRGKLTDAWKDIPGRPDNLDSLNFALYPEASYGFSGSPVFFRLKKSGNSTVSKVVFAGILSAGLDVHHIGIVAKHSEVIKILKEKLKH
jgi:hypothetical protein